MKLKAKILKWWHDGYYFVAPKAAVIFALTCQQAAEQVDMGISKSILGQIRFFLHMSLCQGCRNYLKTAAVLKFSLKSLLKTNQNPDRIENLTNELLKKYRR